MRASLRAAAGVGLLVSALTVGGGLGSPAVAFSPAAAPRSTTPVKTFTTTMLGGTKAIISNHGNVISYLSPNDNVAGRYEHIGVGDIGEGYVLCYTGAGGTVNAYDTGVAETGFGASSIVSQNATSITVRRNTNDNRITLTQLIKFVPSEREVQINMTLKNNTGSPVPNVVLRRQVDFDVDAGGADGWAGFQSYHAATSRTSAFAFNDRNSAPADKEAHAMQLRFLGQNGATAQRAYVTTNILDNTCNADSKRTSGPDFGDYGETMLFNVGTLPSNSSRFANVAYSRF